MVTSDNKSNDSPRRRKPKQSRSINTVESILQAAEELFVKYGFDNTTIEHLAKRAGVGTSSVYDYFPNKVSIALALLESVALSISSDSRFYFSEYGRESIENSLPKVVRKIYESYKRHKNIVITLVDDVPELRKVADVYSIERLIYRASLIYLQIYEERFMGKSLNNVHALLNMTFSATIKQYLSDTDPQLDEEKFLNELSNMFLTYVIGSANN